MNMNRILSLVLFIGISVSMSGCLLHAKRLDGIDVKLNPWLGKSKDERMKVVGPPDKCAALSAGGEVCEWSARGVSNAPVNCSWDYTHGGHQCQGGGGGSWEHHAVYTYDQNGIATEWNYNGSLGQRSSKESQEQSIKEARLNDQPAQAKTKIQDIR